MNKKQKNSNGICIYCKTKSIHYSILNGSFTYYCTKCNKVLNKRDVEVEVKRFK